MKSRCPMEPILRDADVVGHIKDSTLFYPCAGADFGLPFKVFAPICKEFWFVDTGYFARTSPDDEPPAFGSLGGYRLLESRTHYPDLDESDWNKDRKYGCKKPPIRTETYQEVQTGRIVVVHRHRRRGPSALRKQVDRIGVFFYRGDSDEGGSATQWLTEYRSDGPSRRRRRLIYEVLDKLIDNGLLVTDGSMCKGGSNPYRELRNHAGNDKITCEEAVNTATCFSDNTGRRFTCIGCLGHHHHYGPTLIWQVTKS